MRDASRTGGSRVGRWLWGRDGAPWLLEEGRAWSRAAARAEVRRCARRWGEAGLRPGDRLGWLPQRRAEGVLAALGALEAGAELVLLPLRETAELREEEARRLELRGHLDGQGHLRILRPQGGAPAGVAGRICLRSSGSLGRPRWLRHSLAGLLTGALAAARRLELNPGACWELSLPLDHVGGLGILLRGLVSGCRLRCPGEAGAGGWRAADGAGWLSLVPAQLHDRLEAGEDPRGWRGVLLGGAHASLALRRRASEAGWPLWVSYGASESGALVCAQPWSLREPGPGSGRPFAPHRVWLDGEERVNVASPALYEAELDEGGRPVAREGEAWRSGDLGRWEAGCLVLRGRLDRLLVSGGEKIPAERLEEALEELPEVRRAAVVGVPDERLGLRPAAFLEWLPASWPTLDELRGRLGALPRHMHPAHIWPWPAELAGSGKPPLAWLGQRARELAAGAARPEGLKRPG